MKSGVWAQTQGSIPGPWQGFTLAVLTQTTRPLLQLASDPRAQLPEFPVCSKQPTLPPHKAAAQSMGLGQELELFPQRQRDFFSSHDRFNPASPTSHGGQGRHKETPRERNLKLQAEVRAQPGRLLPGISVARTNESLSSSFQSLQWPSLQAQG